MQLKSNNYFYVYIISNEDRSALHSGVTSELASRLYDHASEARQGMDNYAAKNGCMFLVYWEHHPDAKSAILREKQLQGMSAKKKQGLILDFNPEWRFLNDDVGSVSHLFLKTHDG